MLMEIGKVILDGMEDVICITDFYIEEKPDEHAVCKIEARLKSGAGEFGLESEKTVVFLKYAVENTVLFAGYVNEISIHGMLVHIEMVSCSIDLDLCKRSRSFQDVGSTFGQVANAAVSEDQGLVIYEEKGEQTIGSVLYQYEESNWEFIKRLAGLAASHVYPDASAGRTIVSLGICEARDISIREVLESSEGANQYYANGDTVEKITCSVNVSSGTTVSYGGKNYAVISKKVYVEKSIVIFEYELSSEEAATVGPCTDYKACGLVLKGTALEISADTLKVNLDMDQKYGVPGEFSYPWETITGNLLYCMPEKNAKVILNLNDPYGSQAGIISCMRKSTPPISPEHKVFSVSSGKKMQLDGKDAVFMNFGNAKCKWKITLTETEKICMDSSAAFSVCSINGDITADTENTRLDAPNQIMLSGAGQSGKHTAQIAVNTTVEIAGKEVVLSGTARIEYQPFQDAPKDTGLSPASILKLALKVLLTVAVVAAACVVAVALAPATAGASLVVAGVIGTCVVGGLALSAVSVYSQYKDDQKNGIKRSAWDYMYMSVDKFCTGAILTAPMAVCPTSSLGVFGLKMLGTAWASAKYQEWDRSLDQIFNHDFYDSYDSFYGTMIFDIFCNGFGEAFAAVLGPVFKGLDKLLKGKFPYLNIGGRTQARQYLRSQKGVNQMNQWREILKKALAAQEKYRTGIAFLDDTIKNLFALFDNQYFVEAEPLFQEEYKPMIPKQYFDFDESGNLVIVE